MKKLFLEQGSAEWMEARSNYFCASDASAMLGKANDETRQQLIHRLKTGEKKAVSEFQQSLFDDGHKVEDDARKFIESEIGFELERCVGVDEVDGLQLLASFDGYCEAFNFEHKALNASLAESLSMFIIPDSYKYQLEQQLLIAGNNSTRFVCSDGTKENWFEVEYVSEPAIRKELIQGWKQFQKDLFAYQPTVKLVAEERDELPAISFKVEGRVLSTNISEYKTTALAIISEIKTTLITDQDFVDAKAVLKWCESSESDLKNAKKGIIEQTASIAELIASVEQVEQAIREKRLILEKMVKSEEQARKNEIINRVKTELADHLHSINEKLDFQVVVKSDFESAIKGKKTLSSCETSARQHLLQLILQADELAELVKINQAILADNSAFRFLFSDAGSIIFTQTDLFKQVVEGRIASHKAEVQALAEKAAAVEAEKAKAQQITLEQANLEAIDVVSGKSDSEITFTQSSYDSPIMAARIDRNPVQEFIDDIEGHSECCDPEPVKAVELDDRLSIDDVLKMIEVDESLVVIHQPEGFLFKAIITKKYLPVQSHDLNKLAKLIKNVKSTQKKVV